MKKILYISLGSLALLATAVKTVLAQTFQGVQFDPEGKIKKATNLTDESPENITVNVIQWAIGILGLVAVTMIIFGGVTWMTAGGNEEKISKAKGILRGAIIGLIVVLLAWVIVTFVVGTTQELSS